MNNTILYLVMSTNKYFFKSQNDIVRKTWGEGKNVIFYEGGHKTTRLNGDVLELNCGDDLDSTFQKTYFALKWVYENMPTSYVFRTNTSTYVNTRFFEKFINEDLYDDDVLMCSELYSLSESCSPYPLTLYGRGNGLLFSRRMIKIFLDYGTNFLFLPSVDDVYIGNVLNAYWMRNDKDSYLNHIKSLPHAWYKCVPREFDCNHKLSNFGKVGDVYYYKDFATIQIKCYRNREAEQDHYYELHEIMKNNNEDYDHYKLVEYMKNPSVFIGSAIGYMDYDNWVNCDKNWLYNYEISHKANDDEEHYKHYDKQVCPSDLSKANELINNYKQY